MTEPAWMLNLDPQERLRIKNNTQRVFAVLLDGKWHSSIWFRDHPEIGGLRWQARLQELREPRYGALTIDRDKDPAVGGKAERYRLDLDSVTDEWRRRILTGDIEKVPEAETKRCSHCGGTGRVRKDEEAPEDLPADAFADLIEF